jgi:predicted ATPase
VELVGRDGELAAVRRWLAGRLSPQPDGPPVLLVSGEAGVGKTALVEAVLAEYGTLAGRGAGSPWYPAAFGVLRSAVPGWNGVPEPAEVRKAMPAVLFLEDLQWSDDASLELLAALAEAIAGDPVAVVGAYRGDELPRTHLLRRVRAGLRHARCLTEVPLRPLDPDSVTRLVAGLLGAEPVPALATVVSTRTEGMPFFVAELVAALRDAGRLVPDGGRVGLAEAPRLPVPDTVRDAVLLRVSRLPEQARATLDAAALVGADFDVDTVLALVGSDAWPDELDHSGLIALADNGSGRFRHALAQEAVYDDIPWSRRRALHLALADRLSARGAAALLVAAHLLAGHDNDRARPALLAAADDQMRVHAYSDAARLLRQALELWPLGVEDHARLAATDRLARCAELTGEHTEAISLLRELIDGQPDRAPAPVHRRMALQLELVGQWPAALAARETAAAAFASAGDPGEAAIDRLAAAAHLRSAGGFRAALEVLAVARVDASRAYAATCCAGWAGPMRGYRRSARRWISRCPTG